VTQEELIRLAQEILDNAEDPEGFYTADEWADMLGVHVKLARARLKKIKDAGRLELADITREALDGRPYHTTGYRIVAKPTSA
jgi:predicted ArsR family transcriptional regulator